MSATCRHGCLVEKPCQRNCLRMGDDRWDDDKSSVGHGGATIVSHLAPSPASAGSRTQNVAHAALARACWDLFHIHTLAPIRRLESPTSHATRLLRTREIPIPIEFIICAHMYVIESLYRCSESRVGEVGAAVDRCYP